MSDDPTFWISESYFEETGTGGASPAPEHDFSTLKLPIEPGAWRDADDRMFHACFVILGQYIEEELGTEPRPHQDGSMMHRGYRLHSADGGGDHSKRERAAIDLWLWYRNELPVLKRAYDEDVEEVYAAPGGLRYGEPDEQGRTPATVVRNREPKFPYDWPETVKDAKLRGLMDLRRYLWT